MKCAATQHLTEVIAQLQKFEHEHRVTDFCLSGDGKTLVTVEADENYYVSDDEDDEKDDDNISVVLIRDVSVSSTTCK